ncbi:MAG: hypothetical protein EBR82_79195 [Caulobacteraceae bacterium]|nr:hypothetical protein [Caulobacteraceae bacterium]
MFVNARVEFAAAVVFKAKYAVAGLPPGSRERWYTNQALVVEVHLIIMQPGTAPRLWEIVCAAPVPVYVTTSKNLACLRNVHEA